MRTRWSRPTSGLVRTHKPACAPRTRACFVLNEQLCVAEEPGLANDRDAMLLKPSENQLAAAHTFVEQTKVNFKNVVMKCYVTDCAPGKGFEGSATTGGKCHGEQTPAIRYGFFNLATCVLILQTHDCGGVFFSACVTGETWNDETDALPCAHVIASCPAGQGYSHSTSKVKSCFILWPQIVSCVHPRRCDQLRTFMTAMPYSLRTRRATLARTASSRTPRTLTAARRTATPPARPARSSMKAARTQTAPATRALTATSRPATAPTRAPRSPRTAALPATRRSPGRRRVTAAARCVSFCVFCFADPHSRLHSAFLCLMALTVFFEMMCRPAPPGTSAPAATRPAPRTTRH